MAAGLSDSSAKGTTLASAHPSVAVKRATIMWSVNERPNPGSLALVSLAMVGLCHNWHMPDRATSPSSGAVVDLLDVLGRWSDGQGPLFRKLARAVASAVERGVLANDSRLPSERALAQTLAIGRGTAVAAYELVVVDDPTYPGAVAAFTQAGARLVGVPVDDDGVRVDALSACLAVRPALVYLQSTVQSPTGSILPASRRRQIAALVADSHVPLVEDLALADLAWRDAPAPIAAEIPHASVAVVGSLSKLFWG